MTTSSLPLKALFRLDSGGKYGLGHVMRSKALADALNDVSIECTFSAISIHSNDAVYPHQLKMIHSEEEFLLLAQSSDVIVIDHYGYTTKLFFQLSKLKCSILVVLDDECNRGHLYADIIINPVSNAKTLPYEELSPKAQLLIGPEYILLRSLFKTLDSQLLKHSNYKQRNSIVLTFGGTDVAELTLPVLKLMKDSSLADYDVIVVTGAGCKHLSDISTYCQVYDFAYQHNVKDMAALFSTARLAISAAGSTVFELAYCGVPSVFAVVADNQLLSVKEQCESGWCQMVDCRNKNSNQKNAEELIAKAEQINSSDQLEQLSQFAQSQVDGQGAERIALSIKSAVS